MQAQFKSVILATCADAHLVAVCQELQAMLAGCFVCCSTAAGAAAAAQGKQAHCRSRCYHRMVLETPALLQDRNSRAPALQRMAEACQGPDLCTGQHLALIECLMWDGMPSWRFESTPLCGIRGVLSAYLGYMLRLDWLHFLSR
jgi:hypothetical protein